MSEEQTSYMAGQVLYKVGISLIAASMYGLSRERIEQQLAKMSNEQDRAAVRVALVAHGDLPY